MSPFLRKYQTYCYNILYYYTYCVIVFHVICTDKKLSSVQVREMGHFIMLNLVKNFNFLANKCYYYYMVYWSHITIFVLQSTVPSCMLYNIAVLHILYETGEILGVFAAFNHGQLKQAYKKNFSSRLKNSLEDDANIHIIIYHIPTYSAVVFVQSLIIVFPRHLTACAHYVLGTRVLPTIIRHWKTVVGRCTKKKHNNKIHMFKIRMYISLYNRIHRNIIITRSKYYTIYRNVVICEYL